MGTVLLVLAGIGLSLAGLFHMAPGLASIEPAMKGDIPPTTAAIIHGLGGLSGMLFSIAGMLCLSSGLKRDARWASWWRISLGLGLAALLLFGSGFLIDSPQVVPCCVAGSGGWVKAIAVRLLFGALAVWQFLGARKLRALVE